MKGCAIRNELHSLLRLNLSTFDAYHQVVLLVPRHGTETTTRWYTEYLSMVQTVPKHGTIRYLYLIDYKHAIVYRNICLIRSDRPSARINSLLMRKVRKNHSHIRINVSVKL